MKTAETTRATPEAVMATCALFHARRAARAITAHFDHHFKTCGIRATQFSLLVAVSQSDGHSLSEIAAYMAIDRTALARDLRIMEANGLVKFETPVDDRRSRLLRLTAKGTRQMREALPHWRAAQNAVEAAVSRATWPPMLMAMQDVVTLA